MTSDTHAGATEPVMLTLIRQVIEEFSGPITADLVTPEARLADLGIRSLLLFPFISRLEEVCGVTVADSDFHATNFATVGSVCAVLGRSG